MASKTKGARGKILLRSTGVHESDKRKSGYCYTKIKNPQKTVKLKLRKYDPYLRMHVIFEEARLVYQAKK
jgi:ribosomal protein L33